MSSSENIKNIVSYIVQAYTHVGQVELIAILFLFDREYLKSTTKTFTGLQYAKTPTGVKLYDTDITVDDVPYVLESNSYWFVGKRDTQYPIGLFERRLLDPIMASILDFRDPLPSILEQDVIWKETPLLHPLEWSKYAELYKNERPKILDPEAHNRILNLRISNRPIMPLVRDDLDNGKSLEDSLASLDEISRLEKNWNLYGADPVNRKAINHAKEIVSDLHYQPDNIRPYVDGVQLEFNNGTSTLEVSIAENKTSLLIECDLLKPQITDFVNNFYLQGGN